MTQRSNNPRKFSHFPKVTAKWGCFVLFFLTLLLQIQLEDVPHLEIETFVSRIPEVQQDNTPSTDSRSLVLEEIFIK